MNFLLGFEDDGAVWDKMKFDHFLGLGKTRTGKSNFILNYFKQAVIQDMAAIILDPGGDLAVKALGVIPTHREKDVILIDAENYAGYNPLELSYGDDYIVDMFAGTLNRIVKLINPDQDMTTAMLDILTTVIDQMLPDCRDIRELQHRLRKYKGKHEDVATAERVAKRVGNLLRSKKLLQIVTSPTEFDMMRIANEGKILLIDARGMPPLTFKFLAMLITSEMSAYIRCQPLKDYKPLLLVCDEFQNFCSYDMSELFAEAGKCQVQCIFAHQSTSQVPGGEETKRLINAIHGTAGNYFAFRTGGQESRVMESSIGKYGANEIMDVEDYHCFLRLGNKSFKVESLPPPVHNYETEKRIRERLKYKFTHTFLSDEWFTYPQGQIKESVA